MKDSAYSGMIKMTPKINSKTIMRKDYITPN